MNSGARMAVTHIRRYAIWYAVAVIWALAMTLVPVVRHPIAQLADRSLPARSQAASPRRPRRRHRSLRLTSPTAVPALPEPVPAPPALPPAPPVTAKPSSPPPSVPDQGGLQLPALPPLPIPELPSQLDPLFHALSPLMSTGCSGLGLAAVVIAVAAPTVEDVPLDQLLPYLVPAYTVCSLFPIPKARTVCPLDDMFAAQLPDDVTSLFPAPTLIGLGIDEIAGIEAVVAQTFGMPIPSLAESLTTQLGCRVVA